VSGGAGNLDYSWIINGAEYSTASSVNYTTGVDTPIALLVEDECGNSASDDINIFIPPVAIQLSVMSDTTICLYDGVMLRGSALGGIGDLVLSWDGGPNESEVYVTPQATTSYRLFVEDQCNHFATATVTVYVDFVEPNFLSAYVDDEVVELTNLVPDSLVTFWEFSDGSISNDYSTVHRFNTVDEWVATLHAYSANGCHNEVSQTFEATGAVFIPTTFTPNADGINDLWKPVGRDLVSYYVRVFNRFGEIVFDSRDMSEYWTGNQQGGEYYVADGVYSFILQATDARYNSIERSGHVTITR
jgi:gliding motility-associated-like protein